MAGANERNGEIARWNSCVFPRDLLQRFISNSSAKSEDGEEEEIELDLGLSLGGRFGVDKSSKKLARSSSVVGTMPLLRENHHQPERKPAEETSVARVTGLTRTTSLPVESEEEWRKRKEMQSLRRMEAKRRRSEKLRMGGGGGGNSIIINSAVADNNNIPGEGSTAARRRGRPSGVPRWPGTANRGGLLRQHSAGHGSLQGSLGSSSSVSELETKGILF